MASRAACNCSRLLRRLRAYHETPALETADGHRPSPCLTCSLVFSLTATGRDRAWLVDSADPLKCRIGLE